MSLVEKLFTDPSNLVLVLIVGATLCIVFHGKTLVKVPRYGGFEVKNKVSGEQLYLGAESKLLEQDNKPLRDPSKEIGWEPPCLPNEAPDYEEKKLKLEEQLNKMEVADLLGHLSNKPPPKESGPAALSGKQDPEVYDEDAIVEVVDESP